MQKLKHYVRSPVNPLAQVAKRMHENDKVHFTENHSADRVPLKMWYTNNQNNCYLLENGSYAFIREVRKDNDSNEVFLACDVVVSKF